MKQKNESKRIKRRAVHYLTFYLFFYFIVLLFVLMLFLDATKIEQNKGIDCIGEKLGIHAYASFEGCNQKTQLNSVLLEAVSHFNFGSNQQMRRWWYYFQKYGYVPAETKQYTRTSKHMGKKESKSMDTNTFTNFSKSY